MCVCVCVCVCVCACVNPNYGGSSIDCTRKWIGNAVQIFRHPPYGHMIKLRVRRVRRAHVYYGYSSVPSPEVDESMIQLPSLLVQCLSP